MRRHFGFTSSLLIEEYNLMFIHYWNVAGALHSPKGILLFAKVLHGHVKIIFS